MRAMKRINQVLSVLFMSILIGFFFMNLIVKDLDISVSERRKFKQLPKFELESFFDGSFTSDFEKYALDQFPFRETFRKIKGNLDFYVFQKKDVNDVFVYNDYLMKLEYPYNPKSVEKFNTYIKQISDRYLGQSHVYLSIIPDKSYFIADNDYPTIDYELLQESVIKSLKDITNIDLFEQLTLADYYHTDTHWKQENLVSIANYLLKKMGSETSIDREAYVVNTYTDFKGLYYSQSVLKVPKDDLNYLTTEDTKDMTVINYEKTTKAGSIYDLEQLDSLDPYNIFLSGATPLIEITNPKNTSGKELIIFRDSFASSLTPLLVHAYSKITLIDTRYMSYEFLGDYVTFENKDVLFLYNTAVINNSQMLK